MARPSKQGLDYFPFDVDLLDNEALDFLRERYGAIINDIYIALLCFLYKKKGYYIPYETETDKQDCIWYIYKKIRGGKYPAKKESIPEMIEACVAQGLFSGDHYPKIITSERAQATFYSCTVERRDVEVDPKKWILDDETMGRLSKKHSYYLSLHSNSYSTEKQSYSDEKRSKSTEKPLNKSKVNKKEIYKENPEESDEIREPFPLIAKESDFSESAGKNRKRFIPPTLEEVQAYAEERGRVDLAKKFFDYFEAGNWHDSEGKPVKAWKQKFITWEAHQPYADTIPRAGNGRPIKTVL